MFTCKRQSFQRGFTIIELVIFIVVVSIAVVGVLRVMNLTTSNSADPQLRKQALVVAEAMLEEVQQARFTFCDPILDPAAETATNAAPFSDPGNLGGCNTPQTVKAAPSNPVRPFYNVTDYVQAFNTPQNYTQDATLADFPQGLVVSVTVAPEAALGPSGALISPATAAPASMNALRITVTVTYAGQSISLVGYRTRYAGNLI